MTNNFNIKSNTRVIFHIDMNCFFASCAVGVNKSLKGKAIVIAHKDISNNGMVLSATYEARAYGIKTTMLVHEAYKRCPFVTVVEPDHQLYVKNQEYFVNYLSKQFELIEVASIDECYIDVTNEAKTKHPYDIAKKIQDDLVFYFSLPCSIGIAPNKFLAKMASDYKKPLGITIFRKRDIQNNLWLLPIESMFGVGKQTAIKLKEVGIDKIGDLANFANLDILYEKIGKQGADSLIYHAKGNGSKTINANFSPNKSMSAEHTFSFPVLNFKVLSDTVRLLTNSLAYRMQKQNLGAKTVGIILKYQNENKANKSKGLVTSSSDEYQLNKVTYELLEETFQMQENGVRLVGVFVSRLINEVSSQIQLSLLDDNERIIQKKQINILIDEINNRYNSLVIQKGIKKTKK
jgi:DNA polymerase-4